MRDDVLQPVEEPRVDAAAHAPRPCVSAPRRSAAMTVQRRSSVASRGRSPGPPPSCGSSQSSDRPPISRLRTAFCSAASKLRSIAITSPVAFICVPILRSPNWKLVEGPARDLDHAVVQRRLERGGRALRDGVGDLVQPSCRPRSWPPRARSGSRSPCWPAPSCARRAG